MWTRKELKKDARKNIKGNYWRLLGVSLLIAFVLGGMKVENDISTVTEAGAHLTASRFAAISNVQVVDQMMEVIMDTSGDREGAFLEFAGERYTPTKGVLAHIYNSATQEKSFLYGFLNAINNMAFKDRIGPGVVVLIGALLAMCFSFFIVNVLIVGQCRFVLESRIYHNSKIGRLLFPWRAGRWKKTAMVMMKRSIYVYLWDITIIGGIIKRYSYKMIPYIMAENPDVSSKEAFMMSMDMMKGNKFKAFKLDLSMFGWYVLSFLTLGLVRWFFINPYVDTIYAELYTSLRQEAIDKKVSYAEYFNAPMLCAETSLSEYPVEMHPLYREKTKTWLKIDYHRSYSPSSAILMFFTFSMVGWIWEVSLRLFNYGEFVNRGTLHGPWLPVYGAGGVLIVLLLRKLADKPVLLFIGAVALCGVVEYTSAWILWERFHMKWWDYSGYFLNLHGRICAEGLIIFGLGGCGFVYILAPLCDELYRKIPKRIKTGICTVLITAFLIDGIYSGSHPNAGEGVTDYGSLQIRHSTATGSLIDDDMKS